MKKNVSKRLLMLAIAMVVLNFSYAQPFTTNFLTAPTFIDYPGYPAWKQIAEVTLNGVVYQIENSGNDTWAFVGTGGNGNSSNLQYSPASDAFLTIHRKDNGNFTFYGAWLKYSTYTVSPYAAPWLTATYSGSTAATETYDANSTVVLNTTAVVSSVQLYFHGLTKLNFDDLIVGPAPPTVTNAGINQFSNSIALLSGNVTSDGGFTATEKGFVYNTTGTPTVSDTKVAVGSGTGAFTQTITGLANSTTYYVRAYGISSVGTGYSSQQSFTTAGPFILAQTHNFNSAWVSTNSQATPFTKYVEGWDVTATASGGLVSVTKLTATSNTGYAAEGASLRATSATAAETLVSLGIKANSGVALDLQSFKLKYLTKIANTSFGTITVTGYKNGTAVPGAVKAITGIAQATATVYGYTDFDLSSNNSFNNIDQFIITASNPVASAKLSAIDIDAMVVQALPAQAPNVTTESATAISSVTAVLHGTVNDNGGATTTGFEWGLMPDLSDAIAIAATTGGSISAGTGSTATTVTLAGLTGATMYYFRATGTNSGGTNKGTIASFSTNPPQTQYTEPFETFSQGQTTFTSNGVPFSLYPVPSFHVDRLPGWGYNSSNQYLSNAESASTTCSIKTTNGSSFTAKSIWLYPSSNFGNNPTNDGPVTIRGKKGSEVLFTMTIPASAFTGILIDPVSRGFAFIDFSAGVDNSNTDIDELEFDLGSPLNYFALDNFKFAAYTILPLRLSEFSGQIVNGQTQLHWTTYDEQNVAGFNVEYSTDGAKYLTVGNVAATNRTGSKKYNFTHATPVDGFNYYRLKMMNMDGTFTYSNVVKVKLDNATQSLKVSPNPASGNFIYLDIAGNINQAITYTVTDVIGRILVQGNITQAHQPIEVSKLAKGNYYIQLSNGQSASIIRQ